MVQGERIRGLAMVGVGVSRVLKVACLQGGWRGELLLGRRVFPGSRILGIVEGVIFGGLGWFRGVSFVGLGCNGPLVMLSCRLIYREDCGTLVLSVGYRL